jgi:hypothetical protein
MLQWNGKKDISVEVTLNTDYYQDDITGEELVKWTEALQSGAISFDTFFYNLSKKEAYQPGKSIEKEKMLLNEDGPWIAPSEEVVDNTADQIIEEESVIEEE